MATYNNQQDYGVKQPLPGQVPPPGYGQPTQPQVQPVYVQQPVANNFAQGAVPHAQGFRFGRVPAKVICQFCNCETTTSIGHKNGLGT